MRPSDFSIYDIIYNNAMLHGSRDCLVFKQKRLRHDEYKKRCDRLAKGLLRTGIEKGDRIGVLANNCDEYMILYGAAGKIGAIIVPINCRFKEQEIEYVLNDCSPKALFVGGDLLTKAGELFNRVKSIKSYYTFEAENAEEQLHSIEELYDDIGSENPLYISSESGFVIFYTAAIDGHPRGALLSQRNILAGSLLGVVQFGLGIEDANICFLPLYHLLGLSIAMAVMLSSGKNVLVDKFESEVTLNIIEQERITILYQFPPILSMITEKCNERTYDLTSIRHFGGLYSPENIENFLKIAPNAKAWSEYGQTEAIGVSRSVMNERPGSAGRPTLISRIGIFDENDNEVPIGTSGEICVRSPTVFLGYWGREDENARVFKNGWHHTGDIGRFDEKGYLWYVNRKQEKELIKPGGENVYPVEVEKAILEHKALKEVCVIGVPDPDWGEAIKAICTLMPGSTLEDKELIEFVGSRIARYKKPKHVVFVDGLPRNTEGEIDRDQVKREHGGKY